MSASNLGVWTCTLIMDTLTIVCDSVGRLECFGVAVAGRDANSDALASHVVPLRDWRTELVVRADVLFPEEFLVRHRLEAFHHGVVVAVASATHALRQACSLRSSWHAWHAYCTPHRCDAKATRWTPTFHIHHRRMSCNRRMQVFALLHRKILEHLPSIVPVSRGLHQ